MGEFWCFDSPLLSLLKVHFLGWCETAKKKSWIFYFPPFFCQIVSSSQLAKKRREREKRERASWCPFLRSKQQVTFSKVENYFPIKGKRGQFFILKSTSLFRMSDSEGTHAAAEVDYLTCPNIFTILEPEKSVDRRILCYLNMSMDSNWDSENVKCSVR